MSGEDCDALDRVDNDGQKLDKMFTLKKWNAVAMWSWDVECDTCAICRVQVMVSENTSKPDVKCHNYPSVTSNITRTLTYKELRSIALRSSHWYIGCYDKAV